jgi:hypothetical protein
MAGPTARARRPALKPGDLVCSVNGPGAGWVLLRAGPGWEVDWRMPLGNSLRVWFHRATFVSATEVLDRFLAAWPG